MLRLIALFLAALLLRLLASEAAPPTRMTLERVVLVSRHGVRYSLLQGAQVCGVEVWADGADQRTRMTGQLFLDAA